MTVTMVGVTKAAEAVVVTVAVVVVEVGVVAAELDGG